MNKSLSVRSRYILTFICTSFYTSLDTYVEVLLNSKFSPKVGNVIVFESKGSVGWSKMCTLSSRKLSKQFGNHREPFKFK